MAINLSDTFGDRAVLPTQEYPHGAIKDFVSSTDRGTPLTSLLDNGIQGLLQSLLFLASIDPDGAPDSVGNSQYLQGLIEQILGRAGFCSTTGNATSINVSARPGQEVPQSLFDGMTVSFRNSIGVNANTTINAFDLGAMPVRLSNGAAIQSSNLQGLVVIVYNATAGRWEVPVVDSGRIINAISRDILPAPTTTLTGVVRQASNTEVANRSNVTAFVAPDQLPTPQSISFFESSALTFTNASVVQVAHGLGAMPRNYNVFFRCIVAQNGFSVGEEIKVNTAYFNDGEEVGVQVSADTANLYAIISHYGNPTIYSKSSPGESFGATSANWRLVLKASL